MNFILDPIENETYVCLIWCPPSTCSSISAKAFTCSGVWGKAAWTQGRQNIDNIMLISAMTNKSQWFDGPFLSLW